MCFLLPRKERFFLEIFMRDLLHLKRNLRRRSIRKCTFFIVIKSSFFFVFNMIRDSSVNCLSRCCVPSTVIGNFTRRKSWCNSVHYIRKKKHTTLIILSFNSSSFLCVVVSSFHALSFTSLVCAFNFSSKCSVSTFETSKFKLVLPFQHVIANSDREQLSFWTSSSRSKQTSEPWEQLSTCFRVSASVKLGRGVNLEPSGTGSFSTNAKPLSLRIWRSSGMVIVIACFVMNGKVRNKPSWFNR